MCKLKTSIIAVGFMLPKRLTASEESRTGPAISTLDQRRERRKNVAIRMERVRCAT